MAMMEWQFMMERCFLQLTVTTTKLTDGTVLIHLEEVGGLLIIVIRMDVFSLVTTLIISKRGNVSYGMMALVYYISLRTITTRMLT